MSLLELCFYSMNLRINGEIPEAPMYDHVGGPYVRPRRIMCPALMPGVSMHAPPIAVKSAKLIPVTVR